MSTASARSSAVGPTHTGLTDENGATECPENTESDDGSGCTAARHKMRKSTGELEVALPSAGYGHNKALPDL